MRSIHKAVGSPIPAHPLTNASSCSEDIIRLALIRSALFTLAGNGFRPCDHNFPNFFYLISFLFFWNDDIEKFIHWNTCWKFSGFRRSTYLKLAKLAVRSKDPGGEIIIFTTIEENSGRLLRCHAVSIMQLHVDFFRLLVCLPCTNWTLKLCISVWGGEKFTEIGVSWDEKYGNFSNTNWYSGEFSNIWI